MTRKSLFIAGGAALTISLILASGMVPELKRYWRIRRM
jgi:hypothetical protein